jgi:hypothetical protein
MAPQPDYHDWPTKAEVVRDLGSGFSLRNLEYMIQSGKIRVAHRAVPHRRAATVCDPADVARVASERRGAAVVQTTMTALQKPVSLASDALMELRSASAKLDAWPAQLARLQERSVPLKDKLYLAIDEAVEYSGLPASHLHKLIRQGVLECVRADRWLRIGRKSLERL